MIPYTTKSGQPGFKPELGVDIDEEDFDSAAGWCLTCGELQHGCEPDARQYTCNHCGEPRVYGLVELALMNLVA